uniref:Uncharacterized protein n=1 Tax=Anguilla anguilla TaxID=7936 RepID=A0A0E9VSC7_ANGAN
MDSVHYGHVSTMLVNDAESRRET